ncbi:hypothetical protein [uncultured Hymenobacter sp.]|uniref:hypothetical protein n=1 Tax=uncultured Hymenobacter sp. TaxID=170016 RepID=UPI0035CC78BC
MVPLRLLFGLCLLLSLTACPQKEEYPVIVPISFLVPVTITPSSPIMQRGDTLWLEANFSDSLLDRNSGHRYRVRPQDLNLSSGIFYEQLIGIGSQPVGIARTFRLVEEVGQAPAGGALTTGFKPLYDGHYYKARIGLIPNKASVTAISLLLSPKNSADGTNVLDKFIPFIQLPSNSEGREQKAVLADSFYVINDGQANNFDLYRQHTKAFALEPGTPPIQVIYEQKSTFTVEVK